MSADDFNYMSSMTMVAPITTLNNGYPMQARVEGCEDVWGWACVEQMRAFDLGERTCQRLRTLSYHAISDYFLSKLDFHVCTYPP